MIITVYNDLISNVITEGQRKVFEDFGEKIIQIKPETWKGHAHGVDNYLKNNEWDHVIVVDIDCIPLNKNVIKEAREWVMNNIGLYSVAQNANHLPDSLDYASPAFIAFSRKTYEELGEPSFSCNPNGITPWDIGGELTHRAREKNITVKLMYPSNVEIPKWKFKDGRMFGNGTTYEDKIYHHFESRDMNNETKTFIDKCNQVRKTNMYDKIYCINLDKRTDRWEDFQRDVIEGLELDKDKFERISAIDTLSLGYHASGAIGCSLSHLKIWKDMIENKYESALVFEDDFQPKVSADVFNTTISTLYSIHPEFSVCCLGWNVGLKTVFFDRGSGFSFANDISTTSCYIITLEYAKLMYDSVSAGVINMLIHNQQVQIPHLIDKIWCKFQNHDWLIASPRMGIQKDGHSDIQDRFTNYNC